MKRFLIFLIFFVLGLEGVFLDKGGYASKLDGVSSSMPFPQNTTPSSKKHERIKITSQTMFIDEKSSKVIFTGKVILKKGDLLVKANKMVVYYKNLPSNKTSKKEIDHIDAFGNVEIFKGTWHSVSDRAVYVKPKNLLFLYGNCKLWYGNILIKGDKATLDLNTGELKVLPEQANSTVKVEIP